MLPIGDHFTMGPREAAVALELLGVEALRPVPLRHVPAADRHARTSSRKLAPGVEVITPEPGETVEL